MPDQLLVDHAFGHRAQHEAHALGRSLGEPGGFLQKARDLQVPEVGVALPDGIEFRVVRGKSEETGEHTRVAGEDLDHCAVILVDPAIRVAEIGEPARSLQQFVEDSRADFGHRRPQVLEVAIEESVREPRPGRDVLYTQTPEAPLVQGLASCLFQQLAASQGARLL